MRDLDVAPDGRWAVGRDTRGYISRLQAARRRHLPRQHDDRRAHADAEEPADRPATCSASRPTAATSSTGRTTSSRPTTSTRPRRSTLGGGSAGRASSTWSSTTRVRSRRTASPATRSDGKSVIVQHRYDLWLLPLDGSAPRNLTNGVGSEERDPLPLRPHRAARSAAAGSRRSAPAAAGAAAAPRPRGRSISSKPITLSAYGEYTKKAGFYELANGQLKELVYEDAAFSNPMKAAKADKFLFTRQTFAEFPDLRVSGPGFKDAKKITRRQSAAGASTCGAAACCSTSRTRTACGCRASSRCPTTTSRARSGRCS